MLEVAHLLTSPTKIKIFELLSDPISPESIASILKITRQGVDKHLKEFLKYGIAEKMWVLTSKRPRIEYQATSIGRSFYEDLRNNLENYRERGKKEVEDNLKSLDTRLISGEMNTKQYLELKKNMLSELSWFMD